jgi:protein-tyrosine sulfotransferase
VASTPKPTRRNPAGRLTKTPVATEPQPVFLVAPGRSGTTVLRRILDAHPEIGCPGEAGLASALGALGRAWHIVASDAAGEHMSAPPIEARASMRVALSDVMRYYCAREGKRIYCDKSLDASPWLGGIHDVFPEARFVFLYRHVLDVVMSGLEASPWGFEAFGYAPFVVRSVENFVAPLVHHWNTHVEPTIAWRDEHPVLSHAVRYEDLVAHPQRVVTELFEFLDVTVDLSVLDRALSERRSTQTPGDRKELFTNAIHQDSVGRGRRVPLRLIPESLLAETNENLIAVGYEALGGDWWSPDYVPAVRVEPGRMHPGDELGEAMPAKIRPGAAPEAMPVIAIRADDAENAAWRLDLRTGILEFGIAVPHAPVLTGSCDDLLGLIRGEVNGAALIGEGRLRCIGVPGAQSVDHWDVMRIVLG